MLLNFWKCRSSAMKHRCRKRRLYSKIQSILPKLAEFYKMKDKKRECKSSLFSRELVERAFGQPKSRTSSGDLVCDEASEAKPRQVLAVTNYRSGNPLKLVRHWNFISGFQRFISDFLEFISDSGIYRRFSKVYRRFQEISHIQYFFIFSLL